MGNAALVRLHSIIKRVDFFATTSKMTKLGLTKPIKVTVNGTFAPIHSPTNHGSGIHIVRKHEYSYVNILQLPRISYQIFNIVYQVPGILYHSLRIIYLQGCTVVYRITCKYVPGRFLSAEQQYIYIRGS